MTSCPPASVAVRAFTAVAAARCSASPTCCAQDGYRSWTSSKCAAWAALPRYAARDAATPMRAVASSSSLSSNASSPSSAMALARVARRPDEFADAAAVEDLERHRDSAALAAIVIATVGRYWRQPAHHVDCRVAPGPCRSRSRSRRRSPSACRRRAVPGSRPVRRRRRPGTVRLASALRRRPLRDRAQASWRRLLSIPCRSGREAAPPLPPLQLGVFGDAALGAVHRVFGSVDLHLLPRSLDRVDAQLVAQL